MQHPLFTPSLRLACFDMDSTIIQNECIDEMAHMCDVKHSTGTTTYDAVSAITKAAMQHGKSFEQSLQERIAIIQEAGFRETWLAEIYEKRILLSEGAESLLRALTQNHVYTVLISGGFTFFTQKIAHRLGFAEHYGNELLFDEDGMLVGVQGNLSRSGRIIGKEEKRDIVEQIARERQIPLSQTLFGGDGGNDALAVDFVVRNGGIGVAYHATNAELRGAANLHLEKGKLAEIAKIAQLNISL